MITPENIDQVINQIAEILGFDGFEFKYNYDERKLIITESPANPPFIPELYNQ